MLTAPAQFRPRAAPGPRRRRLDPGRPAGRAAAGRDAVHRPRHLPGQGHRQRRRGAVGDAGERRGGRPRPPRAVRGCVAQPLIATGGTAATPRDMPGAVPGQRPPHRRGGRRGRRPGRLREADGRRRRPLLRAPPPGLPAVRVGRPAGAGRGPRPRAVQARHVHARGVRCLRAGSTSSACSTTSSTPATPGAELDAASTVLGDDGLIRIEVTDPESRVARVMGRFWSPWAQPQHLYFLTVENLTKVLAARGFTPVAVVRGEAHIPVDVVSGATEFVNWPHPRVNVPWRPEPTTADRAERFAALAAGAPLVRPGCWPTWRCCRGAAGSARRTPTACWPAGPRPRRRRRQPPNDNHPYGVRLGPARRPTLPGQAPRMGRPAQGWL